ncbi:MAG: cyanophycin synthetase, partial [Burkholderiales bacterium]|nr:cyanophycin synthetase [Burkholderiales bacterium]
YFEFGTLAALWLFIEARVDVAILEVGLGGRLDAVNAFDADCALVMSIDLDHMEYLGDTREAIGFEKAGIFRANRPAFCADAHPPQALRQYAAHIGAQLQVIGEDFSYAADPAQWQFRGRLANKSGLPHPVLRGGHQLANASACIAALDALRTRLPVTINDIRSGLLLAQAAGRFQVLPGRPVVILDVAHNPHAGRALAENLAMMPCSGRTLAVFGMLQDKDVAGVIRAVQKHIDCWLIAGIEAKRGATTAVLLEQMKAAGVIAPVTACPSIASAYVQACDMAMENDRILVFGSFYTVATAIRARSMPNASAGGKKHE